MNEILGIATKSILADGKIEDMTRQKIVALDTTGERIRWLRKRAKLTQAQLGEAIGVGNVFISNIEDGTPPPIERLVRIAQVLGTTTDYLLCLSDVPYAQDERDDEPVYFSEEADEAARLIDAMPAWKRAESLHMIRASAAYNEDARRRAAAAAQEIEGKLRFAGAVIGSDTVDTITDALIRAWTNAPRDE